MAEVETTEVETTETKTMAVYVRRGDTDDSRTITFSYADIPAEDLLSAGYAIDGRSASLDVAPYRLNWDDRADGYCRTDDENEWYTTLAGALRAAEQELIEFLENCGYTVEFK